MSRRRLQEIVVLVVGVTTPLGILAVNASAFVMRHLAEFDIGIAACALISGFCLNGLGAYVALGRARVYAPHLYAEYRPWLIALAAVAVLAWSVLGAYWTFLSMRDARQLPNFYAVLTAVWLLVLPFGMNALSRRLSHRARDREKVGTGSRPVSTPPQAGGGVT